MDILQGQGSLFCSLTYLQCLEALAALSMEGRDLLIKGWCHHCLCLPLPLPHPCPCAHRHRNSIPAPQPLSVYQPPRLTRGLPSGAKTTRPARLQKQISHLTWWRWEKDICFLNMGWSVNTCLKNKALIAFPDSDIWNSDFDIWIFWSSCILRFIMEATSVQVSNFMTVSM